MDKTPPEHKPNPGSVEAKQQGCTCSVWDNHFGKGRYIDTETGLPMFVMVANCPVHGVPQPERSDDDPRA